MSPRIAFAGFNLESVTAVAQVSDIEAFERVCVRGNAIVDEFLDTNTVPGGVLRVCREEGVACVPLFHALLGALGPVSDNAVTYYTGELLRSVAGAEPLDGVVLFLHGASWAPNFPDVEKHIIDSLRAAHPVLPISVALDYHGNVDRSTLSGADIAVAYRHSPHIDMGETGERATRALLRMIRSGQKPGLAVVQPRIVIPSIMSATVLEPLSAIISEARVAEINDDCDISIMAGFSYADSPNTGMSVICLDWTGHVAAQAKAEHFASRLHALRRELATSVRVFQPEDALADLARGHASGRPIVLLEHADRMNDSTHLLRLLLAGSYGRVHVPFLLDPVAAEAAYTAGSGAKIPLKLGGHSGPAAGAPVEVLAKVIWAGPKSYTVSGRYQGGSTIDLGVTALLEVGQVRVSVTSHFAFAVAGDPFTIFGESPDDYDVILLRSKTHFRDFFEPISDRIIVVDTPDLGPADLRMVAYEQLDYAACYPWREDPTISG